MVIDLILAVIVLALLIKVIYYFHYLYVSKKEMENTEMCEAYNGRALNVLIVIPVLREQNVIENTLEHFKKLKIDNMKLTVCIAGTSREKKENCKYNNQILTSVIVEKWIDKYAENQTKDLQYYYAEAMDDNGDRASQLNNAVEYICGFWKPDLIGVYDADSLPDNKTLIEVMNNFVQNNLISCQQPVHFIKAANRMAENRNNPILVANALYQTTWTMIRELPRWSSYHKFFRSKHEQLYNRNVYLIGHGEFISYDLYTRFRFPENEVTDGIQLGYRLAMSKQAIAPLHTFCDDDVPKSFRQLIMQHKRWFGGCMRLYSAYKWSRDVTGNKAIFQMLDGYWSQISWAYAAIVSIVGIILSVINMANGKWLLSICEIGLVVVYCYIIPVVAHNLLPGQIKVRLIDWLCLPIAITLKGIGPNLYISASIISKITKKKIKYVKVER